MNDPTFWEVHESPVDATPFFVDPQTGRVTWIPPPTFLSESGVSILSEDGDSSKESESFGSDAIALRASLGKEASALAAAAKDAFPAAAASFDALPGYEVHAVPSPGAPWPSNPLPVAPAPRPLPGPEDLEADLVEATARDASNRAAECVASAAATLAAHSRASGARANANAGPSAIPFDGSSESYHSRAGLTRRTDALSRRSFRETSDDGDYDDDDSDYDDSSVNNGGGDGDGAAFRGVRPGGTTSVHQPRFGNGSSRSGHGHGAVRARGSRPLSAPVVASSSSACTYLPYTAGTIPGIPIARSTSPSPATESATESSISARVFAGAPAPKCTGPADVWDMTGDVLQPWWLAAQKSTSLSRSQVGKEASSTASAVRHGEYPHWRSASVLCGALALEPRISSAVGGSLPCDADRRVLAHVIVARLLGRRSVLDASHLDRTIRAAARSAITACVAPRSPESRDAPPRTAIADTVIGGGSRAPVVAAIVSADGSPLPGPPMPSAPASFVSHLLAEVARRDDVVNWVKIIAETFAARAAGRGSARIGAHAGSRDGEDSAAGDDSGSRGDGGGGGGGSPDASGLASIRVREDVASLCGALVDRRVTSTAPAVVATACESLRAEGDSASIGAGRCTSSVFLASHVILSVLQDLLAASGSGPASISVVADRGSRDGGHGILSRLIRAATSRGAGSIARAVETLEASIVDASRRSMAAGSSAAATEPIAPPERGWLVALSTTELEFAARAVHAASEKASAAARGNSGDGTHASSATHTTHAANSSSLSSSSSASASSSTSSSPPPPTGERTSNGDLQGSGGGATSSSSSSSRPIDDLAVGPGQHKFVNWFLDATRPCETEAATYAGDLFAMVRLADPHASSSASRAEARARRRAASSSSGPHQSATQQTVVINVPCGANPLSLTTDECASLDRLAARAHAALTVAIRELGGATDAERAGGAAVRLGAAGIADAVKQTRDLRRSIDAASIRASAWFARCSNVRVGLQLRAVHAEEIAAATASARLQAQGAALDGIAKAWDAEAALRPTGRSAAAAQFSSSRVASRRSVLNAPRDGASAPMRGTESMASASAADPVEFVSFTGLQPPHTTFVDRLHRRVHHSGPASSRAREEERRDARQEEGRVHHHHTSWHSVSVVSDQSLAADDVSSVGGDALPPVTSTSGLAALLSRRW